MRKLNIDIINISGSTLNAGTLVYLTGYEPSLNLYTIDYASCDNLSRTPAVGILIEDTHDSGVGRVKIAGPHNNIDTSLYPVNTPAYLGFNGQITFTNPFILSKTNFIQSIGIVAHSSIDGIIELQSSFSAGQGSGGSSGSDAYVQGSGVAGAVSFWASSSVLSSNTNLTWNNVDGYLGVGTAHPHSPLYVINSLASDAYGIINFNNSNSSLTSLSNSAILGSNIYGVGQFNIASNLGVRVGMKSVLGGSAGNLYFTVGNDITKAVLTSAGNFGIGTTSPSGLLGLKNSLVNIDVDGSNNMVFTDPVAGSVNLATLALNSGSGSVLDGYVNSINGVNGYIPFYIDGYKITKTNLFWDSTNSRIGINTIPTTTLSVNGNTRIDGYISIATNNQFIDGGSLINAMGNVSIANGAAYITSISDDGMTQSYLGAVGSGDVVNSGGFAGTFTNKPFALRTNNISRLFVQTNGNVGINTMMPTNQLSVVGNTNIDGYLALLEVSAPNATSNYGKTYVKSSDHNLYFKNQSGTEYQLTPPDTASGTVTSVALTVPSFLSVSGSPITTAGTFGVTLSGTALQTSSGGTGLTSFTAEGVFYASSSSVIAQTTVNATATNKYLQQVSSGVPSFAQVAAADVSGLAASATTDTTNASNITTGTLPNGRLTGAYTGVTSLGTLTSLYNHGVSKFDGYAEFGNGVDIANGLIITSGGLNITGTANIDGYVVPHIDNIYGLGNSSLRWQSVNVGPGSLHLSTLTSETGIARDWKVGVETAGGQLQGALHLSQNGNNTLTLDAYGQVGIGTNVIPNATLTVDGYVSIKQQTTDQVAISGYGTIYTKTDGKLYYNSFLGTEVVVGGNASSGTLNVKNAPYNAVGNGIADDTSILQNAFNDAYSLNLSVFIPEGTYLISSVLTIRSNQEIFGIYNKSIINFPRTGAGTVFALQFSDGSNGVQNAYIHDLNITTPDLPGLSGQVGGAINGAFLVGINCQNIVIQRCYMSNFTDEGIRDGNITSRLIVVDNIIHNIYQLNSATAISASLIQDSIISKNTIYDIGNTTLSHAIYLSGAINNVVISNNIVYNCATGINPGTSSGNPATNVSIIGNAIRNMLVGPCLFPTNTNFLTISGNILHPGTGGLGIEIPGDNTNFTITGNSIDLTSGGVDGYSGNGIELSGGNFNGVISGNTIGRFDGIGQGVAIVIDLTQNLTIVGNTINNFRIGIQAYGNIGSATVGVNIRDNTINIVPGASILDTVHTNTNNMYATNLTGQVEQVIIENNTINNYPTYPISFENGNPTGAPKYISIRYNTLFNGGSGYFGQITEDLTHVIVEGNTTDAYTGFQHSSGTLFDFVVKDNKTINGILATINNNGAGGSYDLFFNDGTIEPTNGTTVINFTSGYPGQIVKIKCISTSITIQNNSNIVLSNNANFVMANGDVIILCQYESGIWTELSRTIYGSLNTTTASPGGNSGQIGFFNSAYTLSSSSNLFWDNTKSHLGIGTNSPNNLIDAYGSYSGDYADILIKNTGASGSSGAQLKLNTAGHNWSLRNQTNNKFDIYDDSNGASRFSIDTSGNILITASGNVVNPSLAIGSTNQGFYQIDAHNFAVAAGINGSAREVMAFSDGTSNATNITIFGTRSDNNNIAFRIQNLDNSRYFQFKNDGYLESNSNQVNFNGTINTNGQITGTQLSATSIGALGNLSISLAGSTNGPVGFYLVDATIPSFGLQVGSAYSPLQASQSNTGNNILITGSRTDNNNNALYIQNSNNSKFFLFRNDGYISSNVTQFNINGAMNVNSALTAGSVSTGSLNTSGNIGINVSSPIDLIDAYGSYSGSYANIQIKNTGASSSSGSQLLLNTSAGRNWALRNQTNNKFDIYDGTAGVSRLTIDTSGVISIPNTVNIDGYASITQGLNISGNFGINSPSPIDLIDAYGSYSGSYASIQLKNTGASTSSGSQILLNTAGHNWALRNQTNNNFDIYDGTSGISRLRIDTSGNVSIGNDIPTTQFSVIGNANIDGYLALQETSAPSTVSNFGVTYVKSSDHNLYFKTSTGTEYQLTPSSGNVSGSGATNEIAYWNGTNSITGTTNLTYNGNLGINSSSPTDLIDAYGSYSGDYASIQLKNTGGSSSSGAQFMLNTTGRNWSIRNQTNNKFDIYDATAAASRLTIDTSGNLVLATGTATFPVGSGTAASITFSGTTDGFYSSSSGVLGFSTSGAALATIQNQANSIRFDNKVGSSSSNGYQFYTSNGTLAATIDASNGVVVRSGGLAATTGNFNAPSNQIIFQGPASPHGEYAQFGGATSQSGTLSGATFTFTNLIPAGSIIIGVVTRVTTAITGATSFSIGDGTTTNAYGNNIAIALNTTTNTTNWTIASPVVYPNTTSIVLTANGSNFTGGVVRCTVHYITTTAPTS